MMPEAVLNCQSTSPLFWSTTLSPAFHRAVKNQAAGGRQGAAVGREGSLISHFVVPDIGAQAMKRPRLPPGPGNIRTIAPT
jgi:hypothetical protein